jgi:serine/threonine-protein phosphatase 2B catalytic subunit
MSSPSDSNDKETPKPKDDTDYKSRVIKEVPAPVWNYIPREQLFDRDGLPIIDNLRKHLLKEGRVDPKDGIEIIQKAANILRDEANLLQLQDPITGTF